MVNWQWQPQARLILFLNERKQWPRIRTHRLNTYHLEDFCLKSLHQQTFFDWRWFLIDFSIRSPTGIYAIHRTQTVHSRCLIFLEFWQQLIKIKQLQDQYVLLSKSSKCHRNSFMTVETTESIRPRSRKASQLSCTSKRRNRFQKNHSDNKICHCPWSTGFPLRGPRDDSPLTLTAAEFNNNIGNFRAPLRDRGNYDYMLDANLVLRTQLSE